MSSSMRYAYVRPNEKDNMGGALAFGYFIDDNHDIVASIAFCSPRDRFCKKTARTIINGRVENGKCVVIPTDFTADPKYVESVEIVMDHYKSKFWKWSQIVNIPSWSQSIEFIDSMIAPEIKA